MILRYFTAKRVVAMLTVFAVLAGAFPYRVEAAPTYVAPSTAASFDVTLPANNAQQDVTYGTGTGDDLFMIIHVTFRQATGHTISDTGVVYAGVTATPFGAAVIQNQAYNRLFYIENPTTGSNTLSITSSDGQISSTAAVVSVLVYSDVDVDGTPYDGYTTGTGSDTSAELTVTSAVGDTPFFVAGFRQGGHTAMAPTNYTERFDNVNGAALAGGGEGTGAASVAFTGTVSGGFSVEGWVSMGANLNAAASAATYVPTKFILNTGHLSIGTSRSDGFSDDFNRANGDSLGSNWTEARGDTDISSNTMALQSHSVNPYTGAATLGLNQYIKATISEGAGDNYPTYFFRYTNAASRFYGIQFSLAPSATPVGWRVWTDVNNEAASIQEAALSFSSGDTIGVTLAGTGNDTTVRFWLNPTGDRPDSSTSWGGDTSPDLSLTNNPGANAVDTGNYVGLGGYTSGAGTTIFDNFFGGSMTPITQGGQLIIH